MHLFLCLRKDLMHMSGRFPFLNTFCMHFKISNKVLPFYMIRVYIIHGVILKELHIFLTINPY